MDADWIKSPSARRVIVHWADPHPSWLWSGDGARLIWRNASARAFAEGRRRSPSEPSTAVPIRGQIARLIRMSRFGRSTPSRLQFLVGTSRPVSLTCACTPLTAPSGGTGLLIVAGEDAVPGEIANAGNPGIDALLPPGSSYLLLAADGTVLDGSATIRESASAALASGELSLPAIGESHEATFAGRAVVLTAFSGGPAGQMLLVIEGTGGGVEATAAQPAAPTVFPASESEIDEPLLPLGLTPTIAAETPPSDERDDIEPIESVEARRSLSSLFDRLASDAELYTSLEDLPQPAPLAEPTTPPPTATVAPVATAPDESSDAGVTEGPPPPRDPEALERVSRYNFDELSRILTDRVGADDGRATRAAASSPGATPGSRPAAPPPQPEGQLVSLAGETFILNRLPLGILLFRDQQVLFANRAIIDMVGYGSVEVLRGAGLAAIFPAPSSVGPEPGAVSHLVQRSGALVPVTARLQSINWQGRPALMLSASVSEPRTGHEAAVRAFAELLAESQQEGFIATDRSGGITHASGRARLVLGAPDDNLVGRSITAFIEAAQHKALATFLERPARFAETARPAISLGAINGSEMVLFAQGQAGLVTGYFGLLRAKQNIAAALPLEAQIEPAMLARLSRGVRRPLNTIVGFADLIATGAYGPVGSSRYTEYARDIKSAGEEIALLVDELDDFNRLREGRYTARPTDIDLSVLLDSCIVRLRAQAGGARVLVRSAISENLPRIHADRASLGQAVLNLLASAIDQTPPGGSVILSAHKADDGAVAINVRDSGPTTIDAGDRFVVFRDTQGRQGQSAAPVRSSVGLALTRSLLAVNACSLSVDPAGETGTLFALTIPAGNVAVRAAEADVDGEPQT